jgi:hypothetical protein
MKKFFTLLLGGIGFSGLNAQVVLTQVYYEPLPGEIQVTFPYDSITPVPRNTGPNQTWDFSAMIPKSMPYTTRTFSSTSAVPASSLFSGATIVGQIGPNQYEFYKSTTGTGAKFELIGYSYPGRVDSLKDTRIDFIWPVTFGNSGTDTYSSTIRGPVTGMNIGTVSTAASGSGTLLLPGGNQLGNILQVIKVDRYNQSVSSPTPSSSYNFTTTTYNYYQSISKYPVVTVITDQSDLGSVAPNSTRVYYNSNLKVGLEETTNDFEFGIVPNPANTSFHISLSNSKNENCTVQICDVTGKLISAKDLGNAQVIKENVSVTALPAGVYFVKTQLGNKASVKKLIVE